MTKNDLDEIRDRCGDLVRPTCQQGLDMVAEIERLRTLIDSCRSCRTVTDILSVLSAGPMPPLPSDEELRADEPGCAHEFIMDYRTPYARCAKCGHVPPEKSNPRPCTCHPADNPPRPCPQKFALSECRGAALFAKEGSGWRTWDDLTQQQRDEWTTRALRTNV